MILKELIDWVFCIFHIFGHFSYNPLLKSKRIPKFLINFTPTILYFFLSTSILFNLFYYLILHPRFTKTISTIGFVFIINEYICSLTAIAQSLFSYKKMIQMSESFQSVEQYLVKKVEIKVNFNGFTKRYLTKVFIILLVYSCMVSTKFFWPNQNPNTPIMELGFSLLRLFVIIPKLHALFYINLLKSFIKLANNIIEVKTSGIANASALVQCKHGFQMLQMLKHYKVIHYQLFLACQQINDTFGWNLVELCVITFLENAFMFYWLFFYFYDGQPTDLPNTLSKYANIFIYPNVSVRMSHNFYLICFSLLIYLLSSQSLEFSVPIFMQMYSTNN